jgi:probable HAF family extracellular repeat protein
MIVLWSWERAGQVAELWTRRHQANLDLAFHQMRSIRTADGSVVVEYSSLTGFSAAHAFRWSAGGGMRDLGTLGGAESNAYGEPRGRIGLLQGLFAEVLD